MPFIPAGYPDLATTAAVIPALEAAGASLIEIGIPFSDPIADGPIIQAAFSHALARKLHVRDVLATVKAARRTTTIPIVAMVSYSIVFRYGSERFFPDLCASGFDGVIIPDLPPPEARSVCARVRAAGLETILLVSPTSPPERRKEIVDLCSGFVYYLSVTGITGERTSLPADLATNLDATRQMTNTPVCVGFGISKPEHVAQLAGHADGAIVGSAYVRKMTEAAAKGPDAIARLLQTYTRDLLAKVR